MRQKSRRGISPVIAAVLLVIIAVAAGVLVWTWISGFVQRNPTGNPAVYEKIKIVAVIVNKTAGGEYTNITAIVQNIGSVVTNISALYILDISGNVIYANTTIDKMVEEGSKTATALGIDQARDVPQIAPQEVVVLTATNNKLATVLRSGETYVLKVVTTDGIEATYTFRAP